jgi:Flp pilus assembly protein TadG
MSVGFRVRAMRELLRRFRADQRGASMIMFGLSIPVLVGIAGIAIDYSRAVGVKSRVQAAADEAALASVAYLRNGGSTAAATTLAQNVFLSNFAGMGGNAFAVQPNFSVAGTQFTANVSVQGVINTTLGQVLGVSALPAGANSQASALSGPSGGGSMGQDLSGSGMIYGDPHVHYTPAGGSQTAVNLQCSGGNWYNLLSDSGLQWNSYCLNDGSNLYFGGSQLQVGTHTISYTPFQGPGFQGWTNAVDSFGNDCVTGVSTPVNGNCGLAFPATLVVDGQTIDPTQFGSAQFTALNDTTENVVVRVQMSNNAIPGWFGAVPQGIYNYLAVDIQTANYEATFVMSAGLQGAYLSITNSGMCGVPGGYFGSFIAGTGTVDPAPYLISSPTFQGGQFDWTPVCSNNGGQIARLVH